MKSQINKAFWAKKVWIKLLGLILLLAASLTNPALGTNADSLGGNPWPYLRSDAADTANGNLHMPGGATIGVSGGGEFKTEFCTQLHVYNAAGTGYFGVWDIYGSGLLLQSMDPTVTGGNPAMTFMVEGAGAKGAKFQLDGSKVYNEQANLLSLSGNGAATTGGNYVALMQIGQMTEDGVGLSIATGATSPHRTTGIYIDIGANSTGSSLETNFSTRPGDYGQLNVLDYIGGGRGTPMAFSDQGSGGTWPMIVFTGSGEYLDSAMIYRWGMLADSFRARSGFFGPKAEVETVKTALCGLRAFGNSGQSLCDTVLISGVAESTTVVTASYAGGFDAATCTPLRIKVTTDTIIVKRGLTTDPGQYYWQAQKILEPSQIQAAVSISGIENPLSATVLPVSVKLEQSYPNPAITEANICYQVSQGGKITLAMYNMLGQKIKTLVDQWQPAGNYKVNWNGSNQQGQRCSAGIYFYKLNVDQTEMTRKLVLAR